MLIYSVSIVYISAEQNKGMAMDEGGISVPSPKHVQVYDLGLGPILGDP